MMDESGSPEKNPVHHKQLDFCTTRAVYRQGRNLTSVKVYTVGLESQHLFIYNVPKIKLRSELKNLCTRYGHVKSLSLVTDHKMEIFTECFHVHYERIQSARVAKRFLDNKSFYGSVLHVCYAPEHETINETRMKLQQRSLDVKRRIAGFDKKTTCSHEALGKIHEPILKEIDPILRQSRNDIYKITSNDFGGDSDSNFRDKNLSNTFGNKQTPTVPTKDEVFNLKRKFDLNYEEYIEYGPNLPKSSKMGDTYGLLNNSEVCDVTNSFVNKDKGEGNVIKRIVFRK